MESHISLSQYWKCSLNTTNDAWVETNNTSNRTHFEIREEMKHHSYYDQSQQLNMKCKQYYLCSILKFLTLNLDYKSSKSGINPDDLKELDYETYEKSLSDGSSIKMYKWTYPEWTKEFNRVWGILDHGRTHKGIKPYSCKWWSKKFTQKGNLAKHLKQHYDPSLEQRKRFICPYCPCKYTEKYNYKVSP